MSSFCGRSQASSAPRQQQAALGHYRLATAFTPANTHDGTAAARWLFSGLSPLHPRLSLIWGDSACGDSVYGGIAKKKWRWRPGRRLNVVRRDPESTGLSQRASPFSRDAGSPERTFARTPSLEHLRSNTFAWLGRYRWLAKDYQRKVRAAEAMITLAMTRLMLRRLAQSR